MTSGTLFHHMCAVTQEVRHAVFNARRQGRYLGAPFGETDRVSWLTALRMLRQLRQANGDRDGVYRLDDAFIGGHRPGKRGRGGGKTLSLVGTEHRGPRMGYIVIAAVSAVNRVQVQPVVAHHFTAGEPVHADTLAVLCGTIGCQAHEPRITPPQAADEWLPKVNLAISLLRRFLLGTFHGILPTYQHEYLDRFAFRFNRRFWEVQPL